jgi:hypothetical protein
MPHTRSSAAIAFALSLCLGIGAVGCSGEDDTSSSASSTTTPSDSTGDSTGDSSDKSDSNSDEVIEICDLVTEAEVGAIVNGTVVAEDQPGGGCGFSQDDPRAPSVAFASAQKADTTDGTFNETRYGAFAVLSNATEEEVSAGDRAAIAIGTFGGGESQQGAGIVQVGATTVQVTVTEASGLDAAAVRELTVKSVELAAGKL